jgi:hypothetical protein
MILNAMGHNHLETTVRYLHTEAGRAASPLQSYLPAAGPAES